MVSINANFFGTKENVCIRKECNSHRTGLGHQHGRRCIVFGHQYGCRDVCENTLYESRVGRFQRATQRPRILLTDNIQNGASCNVNYGYLMRELKTGLYEIKFATSKMFPENFALYMSQKQVDLRDFEQCLYQVKNTAAHLLQFSRLHSWKQ